MFSSRSHRLASLLALLYAALVMTAALWLDDFGRHGPRWAGPLAMQHLQAAGWAGVFALALWWVKEPLMWGLLRRLAAWQLQPLTRGSRRWLPRPPGRRPAS